MFFSQQTLLFNQEAPTILVVGPTDYTNVLDTCKYKPIVMRPHQLYAHFGEVWQSTYRNYLFSIKYRYYKHIVLTGKDVSLTSHKK